jgi:hypothetical protein
MVVLWLFRCMTFRYCSTCFWSLYLGYRKVIHRPHFYFFFFADKLLALLSKGITYNDISNQDVSTRSQCVTTFIYWRHSAVSESHTWSSSPCQTSSGHLFCFHVSTPKTFQVLSVFWWFLPNDNPVKHPLCHWCDFSNIWGEVLRITNLRGKLQNLQAQSTMTTHSGSNFTSN